MDFLFTPEVTDINTVPEQFRGFYTQAGDKHKLREDDPIVKASSSTIVGLSKALKAAREEAKGHKSKIVDLSPLADFGDTPEKILETVNNKLQEAATNGDGKAKQALEGLKKSLQEAHAKEKTGLETRNKALQDQLYTHLVEANATAAIAELKGMPELLMPFVRSQVKVVEADGKMQVQVVDAQGDPRYGSTGALMTVKELISEMKSNQKYARLFDSESPNGSGLPPGQQRRSNTVQQQQQREGMSPTQKIASGLGKGQYSRAGGIVRTN